VENVKPCDKDLVLKCHEYKVSCSYASVTKQFNLVLAKRQPPNWEANHRSDVVMVMHHRLYGVFTYRVKDKDREISTQATVHE